MSPTANADNQHQILEKLAKLDLRIDIFDQRLADLMLLQTKVTEILIWRARTEVELATVKEYMQTIGPKLDSVLTTVTTLSVLQADLKVDLASLTATVTNNQTEADQNKGRRAMLTGVLSIAAIVVAGLTAVSQLGTALGWFNQVK